MPEEHGQQRMPPKPPEMDVSLQAVESAEAFVSGSPNGEAESEAEFSKTLETASEKANPGDLTLEAMKK